ncbi:WecB/TagA/CpsF family glycosyltransferase [Sediminibacterium roseum]|uniref:WecB/TagA/CpsF family glycosyltransferase n=1 Tax=Sediminibacterium roseum TaxID=1978412 RepID=A0ABW9ZTN9_9BACT|nr:WecB/TagA/CpsF family glycosyltransferase [Sediminibacterium roseum]NCI49122.1 WecB/TagA/CpsF family glycosyltransferase [Sediminibacterium roseum]
MVFVLNVPFYDRDIPSAVAQILSEMRSGASRAQNFRISATGAHGLIEARKSPAFNAVIQDFYINLPDGMPVVWVGRLRGHKQMRRCYGPDFFKELIVATANTPINHFFCGGKEGVAEELQAFCRTRLRNEHITGTYSPPFRSMTDQEMEELGRRISKAGADIIWIGLSTPKQEAFAHRLAGYVKAHYIITVGAAFDFHTGRIKQAPRWMQSIGMEWFFRLLTEPRRLYRRYFEIVPKFIFLNIKEFFYFYLSKRHIK